MSSENLSVAAWKLKLEEKTDGKGMVHRVRATSDEAAGGQGLRLGRHGGISLSCKAVQLAHLRPRTFLVGSVRELGGHYSPNARIPRITVPGSRIQHLAS